MNLQRTPPHSLLTSSGSGGSVPNLHNADLEEPHTLLFASRKRKERTYDQDFKDDLRDFRSDIMNFFQEFAKQQNENFTKLSLEVSSLKDEIKTIKASTLKLAEDIDSLRHDSKQVHTDIDSAKNDIQMLNDKLEKCQMEINSRNQLDRMNNVEIKGVPVRKSENLVEVVTKIGEVIGQMVKPSEINFVTRTRTFGSEPKPIIVGFTTRYSKQNFVASAKSYKSLSTEHIGFLGPASKRIFINDHLTRENKLLLTKTKKLAIEKNYKYIWIQNCKILVRKDDTTPIISILSDTDLSKIK